VEYCLYLWNMQQLKLKREKNNSTQGLCGIQDDTLQLYLKRKEQICWSFK
jgi:hypothetical protein